MTHPTPSPPLPASGAWKALLLGAGLMLAAALGHFSFQEKKADLEHELKRKGVGHHVAPDGTPSSAWAEVVTYESYGRIALALGVIGVLILIQLAAVYLSRPRARGDRGKEEASGSARWREGCRVMCSGCGDLGPGGRDARAAHQGALGEGFRLVAGVGWRCGNCYLGAAREVVPAAQVDGREVTPG